MMKRFNKKENLGITLIALVITIIVLLILAGITIAQLTGNGVFDKTKIAKQESENAQKDEEDKMMQYENEINSYVSGNRDYETEINNLKAKINELENKNNSVVVEVTLSSQYGCTSLPDGYTESNCYIDNIMAYNSSNGIYYETSASQGLEAGLQSGRVHVWGNFSKAKIILKKY